MVQVHVQRVVRAANAPPTHPPACACGLNTDLVIGLSLLMHLAWPGRVVLFVRAGARCVVRGLAACDV